MQSNRPSPIYVCGTPPSNQKERFFNKARGQRFETTASNDVTEIDLFDEIGDFGVSDKDFSAQLKNASGNIVLRINSPGGDVFQGLAIYNALLAHKGSVRVEVTGVAASAASIIAMAGDEIAIAENAFIMIHNAWSLTIGNQEDHDKSADLLGQIDQSLANTYAKKTGLTVKAVSQMMADETWLSAADAKANGFATEILTSERPNVRFDVSIYSKAPSELTADNIEIDPTDVNIRELENILRDAGIPRRKAKALAAHGIKAPADLRDEDSDASELAAYFAAKASNIQTLFKETN
jgi:ATP-dependent Clp protease protease subunit